MTWVVIKYLRCDTCGKSIDCGNPGDCDPITRYEAELNLRAAGGRVDGGKHSCKDCAEPAP